MRCGHVCDELFIANIDIDTAKALGYEIDKDFVVTRTLQFKRFECLAKFR